MLLNSPSPFPVPILNTPAACSTVTPPGSTRLPHDVKRDPYQSLHKPAMFDDQAAQRIDPSLAASYQAMGFHITEMCLQTMGRSHQLIASYLRPTALNET